MKNLRLVLSAYCLTLGAIALGGGSASNGKAMVASSNSTSSKAASSSSFNWCSNVHIGHVWSTKAGVANPDVALFTPVADGDTDDSKLGRNSVVGLDLNWHVCDWFSVGVGYDVYTNPFVYHMHHTGATALTAAAGVESLGTAAVVFDRMFNLSHQSALFNVNLTLPEDWALSVGSMNISPVIGGGVGVGLSKVSDFKLVGWDDAGNLLRCTSVALPNSKASLAWQASGGINFQPEDSNVSFGVGYRYYQGGDFASAKTFALNDNTNNGTAVEMKAWTGKLKTHQVRMCLDWAF